MSAVAQTRVTEAGGRPDPSATPAVNLRMVDQVFRSGDGKAVSALRGVDLRIERSEFAVVVGPSGCGKSTLLRLVAGLLRPTAGTVSVFGLPVAQPRNDVGFVFQKPTLLPWLDVFSNVTFPIRHRGQSVTDAENERARDLLAMVGLADFHRKFPDELSGGMQQRVGIARALLTEPDILLMDEPFSALDALTRDEMSFELLRLWSARRGTALFITHSVTEAVLLADRVFIMSARPGRVRETLAIDLPRPRSPDTLSDPLFLELTTHIRNQLLGSHGNARNG